jgi:hypothetical protein
MQRMLVVRMPARRFGVHPALEKALSVIADDNLPEDIDTYLPAQRRLESVEIARIGHIIAMHLQPYAPKAQRAEAQRMVWVLEMSIARYEGREPEKHDVGVFSRTDVEHARGVMKAIALATSAAVGGVEGAIALGEAGALALKSVEKHRHVQHALARALCIAFR